MPGNPASHSLPEIVFSTGSLGHGLSLAAGVSLSAKLRNQDKSIWCLTSDGEWQEGTCWEALIFSRRQNLDNLTIPVDVNKLQGLDTTEEVAMFGDPPARFAGFGIRTTCTRSHDVPEFLNAFKPEPGQGPRISPHHKAVGFIKIPSQMSRVLFFLLWENGVAAFSSRLDFLGYFRDLKKGELTETAQSAAYFVSHNEIQ